MRLESTWNTTFSVVPAEKFPDLSNGTFEKVVLERPKKTVPNVFHFFKTIFNLFLIPVSRVGQAGVVVYQYTRKKFAKIPQNTQNSSKYTQNYTQVYFIPEIQRK